MPIDFIKCRLNKEKIKDLEKHPLLEFERGVNETTGELSISRKAKFKGLTFSIRLNRVWLSGSLHYFFNEERHNYNDFHFHNLIDTLNEIASLFDLDLNKCKLENIEIGVNICLPFKTKFLLNNMLFHEVKKFENEKVKKGKGNYRVATHDRYMIKSYDKALQFGLPFDLWRFELHFNRMADLKSMGVVYLSDLKDLGKLRNLSKVLIEKFDEVFIYDWTINENSIDKLPKNFHKMRLGFFWVDELNSSNRYKLKMKYNDIVDRYSNNIKATIRGGIENKISELLAEKKRPFHNRKTEQHKAIISQLSYSVN